MSDATKGRLQIASIVLEIIATGLLTALCIRLLLM